jgi:MYXO-CTERM domain-containing protein
MSGTGGTIGTGGASSPGFTAGTGTAGTGTGGTGTGAPVPSNVCGNLLCERVAESPESCPADCVYYNYCALAECMSDADCAEGYTCPQATLPGTGGGPNAPVCGDGLCTAANEDADTCPEDCLVPRHCTPEAGYCSADSDCASGFYCSFMGTGGASSSGSGGAGTAGTGSAGTPSATGGAPAVGGASGMPDADAARPAGSSGTGPSAGGAGGAGGEPSDPTEPPTAGTSGELAAGTCMPRDGGGEGGTSGTGTATGGTPATGGASNGGVGTAGSVPVSGTGQGGSGTSGTTSTGSGGSTPPPGSGASNNGSGGESGPVSSGGEPAPGGDDQGTTTVVTHGGCSVAEGNRASSFSAFVLLALGLVRLGRRRRAS